MLSRLFLVKFFQFMKVRLVIKITRLKIIYLQQSTVCRFKAAMKRYTGTKLDLKDLL